MYAHENLIHRSIDMNVHYLCLPVKNEDKNNVFIILCNLKRIWLCGYVLIYFWLGDLIYIWCRSLSEGPVFHLHNRWEFGVYSINWVLQWSTVKPSWIASSGLLKFLKLNSDFRWCFWWCSWRDTHKMRLLSSGWNGAHCYSYWQKKCSLNLTWMLKKVMTTQLTLGSF